MVEGGSTPMHTAAELEAMGFAIVIFPSGLVRAQAKLTTEYFASLSEHGWNQPLKDRMLDFQGLNDLLGTADILAAGQVYDAANFEIDDDD